MSDVKKGGARMIKCCRWKPSGQIVVGACDPVSPNCEPGYFLTVQELENRERRALERGKEMMQELLDILNKKEQRDEP